MLAYEEDKMIRKAFLLMSVIISAILLISCSYFSGGKSASGGAPPKGKQIKGVTFTGIVTGDFVHLEFKTATGEALSFFTSEEGMDYFLEVHKNSQMDIWVTPQMIERPGAPAKEQVEAIKEANAGGITYTKWWADQKAKMSMEEIHKTYDPLIQKYE
jgi:hypothetical protein